jgi:hypothetical protein
MSVSLPFLEYTFSRRGVKNPIVVGIIVIVPAWSAKSHIEAKSFENNVSLFEAVVSDCEPACSWVRHVMLAEMLVTDARAYSRALAMATKAIQAAPAEPDARAVRCAALTGLERYGTAFNECRAALRLAPHGSNLAVNLALLALKAGWEWQARKVILELAGNIAVVECLDASIVSRARGLHPDAALAVCEPYFKSGFKMYTE